MSFIKQHYKGESLKTFEEFKQRMNIDEYKFNTIYYNIENAKCFYFSNKNILHILDIRNERGTLILFDRYLTNKNTLETKSWNIISDEERKEMFENAIKI